MDRKEIIERLPSPTIIRQAAVPHFHPRRRDGQTVTRTAQIISQADEVFFFQVYDVYPNGRTVLDHSEAWATAEGAKSAWREKGWDEDDDGDD